MGENKIPKVLYLFLHSKIFHRFGYATNRKEVSSYMFEWRIPKKLRPLILREMIIMELIKKVDKMALEITKPKFNEEDLSKYYEMLGFY